MSSPTIYDVCVVGAGMWGSTAAYHLSLIPDKKVCLIGPDEPSQQEYAQRTIFGSHYDEGRIVQHNLGHHIGLMGVIAKRATEGYQEIEQKTGMSFYKEGADIYFGPAGSDDIVNSKKACEVLGIEHLLLNRDQLKEKYPYIDIQEGNQCVLQLSKAGVLSPRKYVEAKKTAARLQGCDVLNDVIDHMAKHDKSDDGSCVLEVVTDSGKVILAQKVLLCTGAFTNFKHLLPEHLHPDFVLAPEQTLRVEVTPDEIQLLKDMPSVNTFTRVTHDTDCYIVPPVVYPDGKTYLKIGHGRVDFTLDNEDDAVAWFRSNGKAHVKENLTKILNTLMPVTKLNNTQTDTCMTTNTPSGMPYCDMLTPNIGLLMGGNGEGARLAFEIGRIGAKMIVNGCWDYDLSQEEFKVHFKNSPNV